MANINKIRVSGTTYNIQDINAPKVIELTQAEYDALTVKDPNAFYVLTDSEYSFDGYWTSAQTQNAITQSVSSKADTTAVTSVSDSLTAHTANTTVHVTAKDKTNWNNKSDFSGDYDDLTNKPTIPTVPTNVSDFTNDAGYITSDDISGKTNQSDFTAHTANTTVHVTASEKSTWNSKSDFSGDYNDLSNKPTIPTVPTSNTAFTNDAGYITANDISGKQDVSGMTAYTKNSAFTAHTANTTVHVTANEKSTWNAKSDFSGDYNDLDNKPTIPTSASQLTNDSGYITSSALNGYATEDYVTAATNDMATRTWVGQQGYLTEHQSLIDYYTKSETSGATQISTALASKQSTLESGTNIKTINNQSLLGSGNINIQGGSTYTAGRGISIKNDTISFSLPISGGSGENAIAIGNASNIANNAYSVAEGYQTYASGYSSHAEGYQTYARGYASHAEGYSTFADNDYEHASGYYNTSSSASTTFGNSGNTLFSVGNGSMFGSHNAFEIRQDGSIYIPDLKGGNNYSDRPMLLLQDALGGVNVVQTTGTSTADVMSQDAVTSQLDGKGDAISLDMVTAPKKKVTFQMKRGGINGTVISSRDLTLGRGLVYGEEGFDTLSTSGLVETSAITTSVTSASTDAQVPSAKAVNDKLGGLSLVKLTQAQYDALATKDSNTLYVING